MAELKSDTVSLGDIEAALEDIRAKKARYEAAIATVKEQELQLVQAAHVLRNFLEYRRAHLAQPDFVVNVDGNIFVGQAKSGTEGSGGGPSIVERAIRELERRNELTDTWTLIAAMERSGYSSTAADPYLSVYSSLNKAAKKPGSRIVKVGPQWGLLEWYPNGVPQVFDFSALVRAIVDDEEEEQPNDAD